jgi:hypothetical protein
MMRAEARDGLTILALAATVLLLHGYHYGIEDQTLYLPAIEKALNPSRFPHDSAFFLTQARFTWFDESMAWIVRVSRAPLDVVMFAGHLRTLILMLVACRRIARHCFMDRPAEWSGLLLLVILLPFPIAATRLGLMEQYFHPRGLAIALVLTAFVAALERRFAAVAWLALATAMHPLTGLWGIAHVAFQAGRPRGPLPSRAVILLIVSIVPMALASCSPVAPPPPDTQTDYWREALSPEVFDVRYPVNWPWYAWLGVVAPLMLLGYYATVGRRLGTARFADVSTRLFASGIVGVLVALAITAYPDRRLPLQPMRQLHLVYIVAIVFAGARIEQRFLKGRALQRAVLFATTIGIVLIAQRHFPFSPHIEWPGRPPQNLWAQAFAWSAAHTPEDALFALDPYYLRRPGPDSHSFRAIAERSMLAEGIHDLAPAAMSPPLAARWMEQIRDQTPWRQFRREDFARLKSKYGVSWVILEQPGVEGLDCPYSNAAALVCRVN